VTWVGTFIAKPLRDTAKESEEISHIFGTAYVNTKLLKEGSYSVLIL
jgi:hypothetical protein